MIAVLVILGIVLTAAASNYLSLIHDAGDAAAMQAVAEGKARLHHQYASMLLSEDPHAHKLDVVAERVSTDAGDYQLIFTVSKNHKEVEVEAKGIRNGASGQASGKWTVDKGGT